jgi:hypothetical protein
VVQVGDDHLVAGLPGAGERAREGEGEGGHVRPEGDLTRAAGPQEVHGGLARRGDHRVRLAAGGEGAVHVGVVQEQRFRHRVGDGAGHLAPAGAVEERRRMAAEAALENREPGADGLRERLWHACATVLRVTG